MTSRCIPTPVLKMAAAVLACLGLPAWAVSTCPQPASPPGAQVEMIAPGMDANGMETEIRAVTVSLTVDGVLSHYRALWAPLATPTRPASIENEVQGWRVISRLDGRCLTTVQVRPEGVGSYALVAVARALDSSERAVTARTLELPTPPGARILSDTLHNDPVRRARTVVALSSARLATNAEFYASGLRNQGWLTVMRQTVRRQQGDSSEVLQLKRDTSEISIVITPTDNGQVSIVANIVDRP